MFPKLGDLSGPEYDRLTEKLFGADYLPRPVSGAGERAAVAERLRLAARAEKPLLAEATLWGTEPYRMEFAVYRAVNRLLAAGTESAQLGLSVTAGAEAAESEFRAVLKRAQAAAKRLKLPIANAELRRGSVQGFVMTATAAGSPARSENEGGRSADADRAEAGEARPAEAQAAERLSEPAEYKIVMTGYAGAEGTLELYREREPELASLPKHFRKGAEELWETLDAGKAIRLGWRNGALFMTTYGDGGVFRGLWELGERLRLGMEVWLPDIPLRQQTVEACERFDVNPYQMRGGGSVLMVTAEPERLLAALWDAGVEAAEIGRLTADAARILKNQEEQRYLEPFRTDALAI